MGVQLKPPRLLMDSADGRPVGYGPPATLGQMARRPPGPAPFPGTALAPSKTQPHRAAEWHVEWQEVVHAGVQLKPPRLLMDPGDGGLVEYGPQATLDQMA